jgi:hypothetical protein
MMAKAKGEEGKTKDLPGMEDRAIQPLHDKAIEYHRTVRERMRIGKEEAKLKSEVRTLMKAANRTRYAYDGVEVELTPPAATAEDKVTVKVAEDEDETEAASDE